MRKESSSGGELRMKEARLRGQGAGAEGNLQRATLVSEDGSGGLGGSLGDLTGSLGGSVGGAWGRIEALYCEEDIEAGATEGAGRPAKSGGEEDIEVGATEGAGRPAKSGGEEDIEGGATEGAVRPAKSGGERAAGEGSSGAHPLPKGVVTIGYGRALSSKQIHARLVDMFKPSPALFNLVCLCLHRGALPATEDMQRFEAMAGSVTYRAGLGVQGRVLEHNSLEWVHLEQLVLDPHCAQDARTQLAARMFDRCCAVPVRSPSGGLRGIVTAVIVLYSCRGEAGQRTRDIANEMGTRTLTAYINAGAEAMASLSRFTHYRRNMQERAGAGSAERAGASVTSVTEREVNLDWVAACDTAAGEGGGRGKLPDARAWLAGYFAKIKGVKGTLPPQRMSWRQGLWTWVGTFVGISLLAQLHTAVHKSERDPTVLVGSFGALSTLLFGLPHAPLAQPRIVIGGHVISVPVAIVVHKVFGERLIWLQASLSLATALALMAVTGMTHPPAGAMVLLFITGSTELKEKWAYFLFLPALTGCVILMAVAMLVNNASSRRNYPTIW